MIVLSFRIPSPSLPQIGCLTLDNASNNDTLLSELEKLLKRAKVPFDAIKQRIRCMPHIIHLAAMALLSSLGTWAATAITDNATDSASSNPAPAPVAAEPTSSSTSGASVPYQEMVTLSKEKEEEEIVAMQGDGEDGLVAGEVLSAVEAGIQGAVVRVSGSCPLCAAVQGEDRVGLIGICSFALL